MEQSSETSAGDNNNIGDVPFNRKCVTEKGGTDATHPTDHGDSAEQENGVCDQINSDGNGNLNSGNVTLTDNVVDNSEKDTGNQCINGHLDQQQQDIVVDSSNVDGQQGSDVEHNAVEADYSPLGYDESTASGDAVEPSDEEEIGDTSSFDHKQRNELFTRGLSMERKGKCEGALKCYLACLNGLTQQTRFVLLPQCLRNIAEIYYQTQEYEKAIYFIKAEKMYYETALVSTEHIQKELEELQTAQSEQTGAVQSGVEDKAVETARAEEYEHLAKLCLDRKLPELALEYAGKCAKMRQDLFGGQHPKTIETLDFFATVFAEVGKQQYSESMENLQSEDLETTPGFITDSDGSVPSTPTDGTPVSILRHRKKEQEREKKQVRFHESVVDNSDARPVQTEELNTKLLVTVLFFTFVTLFVVGWLYMYCRTIESTVCQSVGHMMQDVYQGIRYRIYKYTSTKHVRLS